MDRFPSPEGLGYFQPSADADEKYATVGLLHCPRYALMRARMLALPGQMPALQSPRLYPAFDIYRLLA